MSDETLHSIFYRVLSLNPYETYEMKVSCETTWKACISLAELAAKDFYQHHQEGWECSWPLVISIHWHRDGEVKGVSEVDRQMVPRFVAKDAA